MKKDKKYGVYGFSYYKVKQCGYFKLEEHGRVRRAACYQNVNGKKFKTAKVIDKNNKIVIAVWRVK